MSVYRVEVDVATCRPPRADATVFVTVEAPSGHAAELLACQIAMCHPHVVMPVGSAVTDWAEN